LSNRSLGLLLILLSVWLTCPGVAQTSADPGQTGTVEGTVALEPMQQPPVGALYRTRTRTPVLEPDPPRAIVYLERDDGTVPASATQDVVTVSQQGYQFRPGVAAVPAGGRVSFPNRDDEFHNVFSYSSDNRFDLGRFRKDEESPLVTFDEPGLVRVYCEIHKHMRSLLLVLDTPWYTTTDTEGHFRLPDLPPGHYKLRAFLPSERTLESTVSVRAGETVQVELGKP
jgi:plastocyanin